MSELNKQEKRETIAAVVVTYSRKGLLIKCLDALMNQTYPLDAIYIIDNASSDGTPELLIERGYINKTLSPGKEPIEDMKTIKLSAFDKTIDIHYVRMNENTGGAGGFHEGVKRGYEAGYDWLWLMDDDVAVGLESLMVQLHITKRYALMVSGALVIDSCDNSKLSGALQEPITKRIWYKVDDTKSYGEIIRDQAVFFNGILINKKVINQIGFPKKEFFIWGDEVEFFYRIKKQGFPVATVLNSLIYHPSFHSRAARLGWIGPHILATKGLSLYCMVRNYIIIRKEYNGLNTALVFAMKQLIKYFLLSLQRLDLEYFKITLLSAMHGMTNTFGKEKSFLNN